MLERLAVDEDAAQLARFARCAAARPRSGSRRAARPRGPGRRASFCTAPAMACATSSKRERAFRRADAVARHVDVLRRGAHLARVQREREGDVAGDGLHVVRRVDHDLVDARLLGVDLRLVRIASRATSPLCVLPVKSISLISGRSGELLDKRAVVRLGGQQGDDVRIEARFAQHVARDPYA